MSKIPPRKRPCRICRRWFMPNPRVKDRQMTCGQVKCQREWHRKKCAEWNSKNSDYFETNYLQKKIDAATKARGDPQVTRPEKHLSKVPASRMQTGMPLEYVKELIGVQHVIIHEYLCQLLDRRWHKKLRSTVSILG
ncbi:MAG: hypothetical protein H8D87_01745 [Deltaproteobacteria bacterium]|nr:hypothetical protein [Candidatus Desulfobacula maris]